MAKRLFHTRPRPDRHREDFAAARKAGDAYAAAFHLDRLLAYSSDRTSFLEERNGLSHDAVLAARAGLHTPTVATKPAVWEVVALRAVNGDRLAVRLLGQKRLNDGRPHQALPLLHQSLLSRRGDRTPPVEELLIADALWQMNKPDDARRYYRAAVEWLDRPREPRRAANVVTHGFSGVWPVLGEVFKPIDDPRYNSFDWESWHEVEVFCNRIESKFRP